MSLALLTQTGARRAGGALLGATLLAAWVAVVGTPPPAAAGAAPAAAAPAQARWAVEPADADGPDGRRAIDHEVAPGGAVEDAIAVRNAGNEEVTFELRAADGYFTPTGRFDVLAGDQESVAAGRWVSVPDSVTVPAGELVVVPVTVTVPEDAEPGDHAAGITASVVSVQSAADGTSVGVRSRVGVRVNTRVSGDVTAAASLSVVSSDYAVSWNPLRPGGATVTFDVTNRGNTRLLAEGEVTVAGVTVPFPGAGQPPQQLLPGDTRRLTTELAVVWPVVAAPTRVDLVPRALSSTGGEAPQAAPVTAELTTWALPLPQLAVLLGAGLLVQAVLWNRLRSRRRLEALLARARDEGRRQAAPEEVPTRRTVADSRR